MSNVTRRELLELVGASLLASKAYQRSAGPAPLETFALADVRLLEGPFLDAQQRDRQYLLALDPDRLLHNFRVNAGLEPKAPVYGGWESEEPWVGIRCHGHTLGHYLSAAAYMFASTADARMRQRVDYIAAELQACQAAAGTGLVCAFPDGAAQIDNAVAGRRVTGVPWYTMHKVFAGLRDAHVDGGSAAALEIARKLADWTATKTAPMTDAQFQRMLDIEHGGMNEVLADLAALTGDGRYQQLARRFCHEAVLAPLAEGRDALDGLHANTQIPKAIGFQRLFESTGEPRYGRAARFFWKTVTANRSFVTGGHGDNERFFPPADVIKHLPSAKTMETCCTHNMLRLTRALFRQEPSREYMDFYERALFNGILASQDPESGMTTYFQATRPGYVRLFHTPDRSFWCCTGTGMENHAKHGDTIYFHSAEGLWVNLFIASTVRWKAGGLTLRQRTSFPDEEATRFDLTVDRPVRTSIHLRQPAWCPGMSVRVNGSRWQGGRAENGYVAIEREWRSGDRIDVALPMTLRAELLPFTTDVAAFLYGPIVLAGRLGRDGLFPGSQIIVNERQSGTMLNANVEIPILRGGIDRVLKGMRRDSRSPLTFRTSRAGVPHDVEMVPYYRLPHERYNLYWNISQRQGA
jgi:uncharacterized protein